MKLLCDACGPLSANMYLLYDEQGRALLIDPSDAELAAHRVASLALSLQAVLFTHAHFDHMAPLAVLREKLSDPPFFLHRCDWPLLIDPIKNASAFIGNPKALGKEDDLSACSGMAAGPSSGRRNETNCGEYWQNGRINPLPEGSLFLNGFTVECLHTPGHTPGSASFITDGFLFSGDTLFASGIGRCDLYGGNERDMLESLRKLAALPDRLTVYPGHGPSALLSHEKNHNPYLRNLI